MDILKEYFDEHSKTYALRVLDRQSWPHLDLEDSLIRGLLEHERLENKPFSIIDAGCGTGDRLRYMLEKATLPRQFLTTVTGIDYSLAMLKKAALQHYAGTLLFDHLVEADLSKTGVFNLKADVVLSLWGVVNTGAMNDLPKTLSNLATLLTDRGQLVFDVRTKYGFSALKEREATMVKDNPQLPPLPVPSAAWHCRADGTFGAMRYLTVAELTTALTSSGLALTSVWGYHYRSSQAVSIPVNNYGLLEGVDHEEHFPFLLCVTKLQTNL
jgi:SAM-dependent methyltransferase